MSRIGRRTFLQAGGAAAVGALTAAPWASAAPRAAKERPNLLLVITDQQHIDTISAAGCSRVKTPNLDRLVKMGTHFTESYSASPVCCPARSSIVTGRTPSETGVHVNGHAVREGIPNVGEWFRDNSDYECLYAGKWHLKRTYTTDIPGFNVLHTGIGGQGNICDPAVSHACSAYIRNRSQKKPFLMVCSFMQPHDICEWLRLNRDLPKHPHYDIADELPPLPENFNFDEREPAHIAKRRPRNEPALGGWSKDHWRYYRWSYFRHIEQVDAEVGRLLQALDESGQREKTAIVFTSDHGEGLGHHQMVRKSMPYDESAKVPMIVCWPGPLPEDRRDTGSLVSGEDVVPTLCELGGIKPPPRMRGRSLVPVVKGESDEKDRCLITEIPGNYGRLVRTREHKFVCFSNDPVEMLFDYRKDRGETKNLAGEKQYADLVKGLKAKIKEREKALEPAPNVGNEDAWWR